MNKINSISIKYLLTYKLNSSKYINMYSYIKYYIKYNSSRYSFFKYITNTITRVIHWNKDVNIIKTTTLF